MPPHWARGIRLSYSLESVFNGKRSNVYQGIWWWYKIRWRPLVYFSCNSLYVCILLWMALGYMDCRYTTQDRKLTWELLPVAVVTLCFVSCSGNGAQALCVLGECSLSYWEPGALHVLGECCLFWDSRPHACLANGLLLISILCPASLPHPKEEHSRNTNSYLTYR